MVFVINYVQWFYRIVTIVIICMYCTPICAQFNGLRNFSVKDGLPSAIVYDCLEDNNGFMWFATAAGLAQFDGNRFNVFTKEDGLSHNEILQLGLDKDGSIWISAFGGSMCIYDPVSQKILNEHNYPLLKNLHPHSNYFTFRNTIVGLACYGHDQISLLENKKATIFTYRGLADFTPITKDSFVFHFGDKATLLQKLINVNKKNISCIKDTGIKQGSAFYKGLSWNNKKLRTTINNVNLFQFNKDGAFTYLKQYTSKGNINNVARYNNKLYVATTNGVQVLDTSLILQAQLFQEQSIAKVFFDKAGNTWFCSNAGNGIYMQHNNGVTYHNTLTGMPADNIAAVKVNNNSIIIGDVKGNVGNINKQNKYENIVSFTEGVKQINFFKTGVIAYSNWKQFAVINNNVAKQYKSEKLNIKCIIPHYDNNLLLGSSNKLGVYTLLDAKELVIESSYGNRFSCLAWYNHNLYYGNTTGLYVVDSIEPFKYSYLGKIHALLTKPVENLYSTKNGILWIVTSTDGIIALRNNSVIGSITTLPNGNGLSSNFCKKIVIGNTENILWVATNKGLNKVAYTIIADSLRYSVQKFSTVHGLSDNDVNDIFVKDGNVYAATIKGLNIFSENIITTPTPLFIRKLLVNGDTTIFDNLNTVQYLNYKQNNLSIYYAAICYTCDGNINYQYRILGNKQDTSWVNTQTASVELGSLDAGKYIFQVKTNNSNLQQLTIIIKPPFWKTIWFIILIMLLFIWATIFIAKKRVDRIRKREEEKTALYSKITELEHVALRAQMNPHFIFNCLTSLRLSLTTKTANETDKYISVFAKLIRQTLDNASHKLITIHDELSYIKSYLLIEQMRSNNAFTFSIQIDEHIDIDETFMPSMLLQPFVENSIKHGFLHVTDNSGAVDISIKQDTDLICVIKDNGIGKEKSLLTKNIEGHNYESKGMNITEDRIIALNKLYNSNISIRSYDLEQLGDGQSGTMVVIKIPLSLY